MDQTEWRNLHMDDRKEVTTFNRMAGPNRHLTPGNYQINVQLRDDACTDFSRTANLDVAQYSNMRAMPTVQVPTGKYTDETGCYYNNPIQIVTLQDNPYSFDIKKGFTAVTQN
jgi:hypothetical protein